MARMDVSPHELRDSEIPSTFRGYNPEAVDDLLERAAATIESMADRVRDLSERVNHLEAAGPVAAPEPQISAQQAEEQMQEAVRALVLAQRTADETVNEARTRAQQILIEAEQQHSQLVERAQAQVTEAEQRAEAVVARAAEDARREGEAERNRVEQEARELAGKRDALSTDVDRLEEYSGTLRDRVRTAIEDHRVALNAAFDEHLGMLESSDYASAGTRPQMSDVEFSPPAPAAPAAEELAYDASATQSYASIGAQEPVPAPVPPPDSGFGGGSFGSSSYSTYEDPFGAPGAAAAADVSPVPVDQPAPAYPAFDEPERQDPFGVFGSAAPAGEPPASGGYEQLESFESLEAFGEPARETAAPAAAGPTGWGGEEPQAGSDALDDDAFFASLREAVSDDAPLGPAPDPASDRETFGEGGYDDVFRRRQP